MKAMLLPSFYDTHLAPDFSSFCGATLEDLSALDPEQNYWLYNFALNQLSHSLKPAYRELAFNHLRRAHGAFDAYHQFRQLLLTYPPYRRAAPHYFSALTQAETCIAFAAQAFEIVGSFMHKAGESPSYKYAVAADITRLRDFYVASKHVPGMIDGSQLKSPDTVPFWLTSAGFQSRKRGVLSYSQLSAVLRELAYDASLLSNFAPESSRP